MEMIGIGFLALGFSLLLAIPHWQRKRRRREMGLEDELANVPSIGHENWAWPRRWQ